MIENKHEPRVLKPFSLDNTQPRLNKMVARFCVAHLELYV